VQKEVYTEDDVCADEPDEEELALGPDRGGRAGGAGAAGGGGAAGQEVGGEADLGEGQRAGTQRRSSSASLSPGTRRSRRSQRAGLYRRRR
jgi:hypothetical protein